MKFKLIDIMGVVVCACTITLVVTVAVFSHANSADKRVAYNRGYEDCRNYVQETYSPFIKPQEFSYYESR